MPDESVDPSTFTKDDDAAIVERFRRARHALAALGELRSAPLYRTAPIGPAQPAYLNTAVRIRLADVQPAELIATLLEIERLLGRERSTESRWGPRPIDLDVLVWGARTVDWEGPPRLRVPHPRLAERRFALRPLVELLGPDFVIPGHCAAGELEERVAEQAVDEVTASW